VTRLKYEPVVLKFHFSIFHQAQAEVEKLKDRIGELELCKRSAVDASRMSEEIDELNNEIKTLERDLEGSGTTKTADQVQEQLDDLQLCL
jgi:DNA repair protein RAD50